MKRTVFFVSDRTGITAEILGRSLLTQFEHIEFEQITIPYVDTMDKANQLVGRINDVSDTSGLKPLVFATLIDADIRDVITTCNGLLMDFFNTFIGPLEKELESHSSHTIGKSHGMDDYESYKTRIDAVNYVLTTDDGTNTQHYHDADLILVGVSRCGKTPTCLYLALQFGVRAANYPITEEDCAEQLNLPICLTKHKNKVFGLTIDEHRLQAIRQERRPNSSYASLAQCKKELRTVENLYRIKQIPFLNSTSHSIEEISTKILQQTGVKRRLY